MSDVLHHTSIININTCLNICPMACEKFRNSLTKIFTKFDETKGLKD
ncbi:MAG: hypothetical protein QXT06_08360 [Candidatus Bathyarchaeia archaeon]